MSSGTSVTYSLTPAQLASYVKRQIHDTLVKELKPAAEIIRVLEKQNEALEARVAALEASSGSESPPERQRARSASPAPSSNSEGNSPRHAWRRLKLTGIT